MHKDNSGKIYFIPLSFSLGFTLCRFDDYTDISAFDGGLVSVLKKRFKDDTVIPSISEIDQIEVLFGPLPLNKYPNIKGKGAWRYIGQMNQFNDKTPIFKGTIEIVALYKSLDWSKVDKWYKAGINEEVVFCDYESIRGLETRNLYDMSSVELRATMHFLLLDNKKVEDYYDLTIERNRNIYLQMVNTSFNKKTASKYLEVLA